ncbi:MAG: hypothetical protein FGM18_01230 [Burkholderiaceae bacterium]|nr:hypothetical protein [Burkholderiaceae bacterium]
MADPLVRIQGAGPVGILAALFLVKYGWTPSSIELIDPALRAAQPAHDDDPRILALSHGTLVRLAQLGIDCQAERIQHIHVSSVGHFGAMEIKTDNVGVSDLGGLVSYSRLLTILRDRMRADGIAAFASIEERPTAIEPAMRVIAEGGVYHATDRANDGHGMRVVRDYHQHAVVGWVETETGAGATAYERFTADGAVALLPLKHRYALIWCGETHRAEDFAQASQSTQCRMLDEVMGGRVPGICKVEITGSYPLGLKWREKIAEQDTVWIGNSAQALHPVAGQGLNLGFRDAETLAACLLQRGSPIAERLQDYAHRRKADRWTVRKATDTLATAGWVRRAIGGVAVIPGAKRLLGQVLMYGG